MNQYNDKGEFHGYWENYSYQNLLLSKGNYINGIKNGYWEGYWSNGIIDYKGNFTNDGPTGYWEWYNDEGELVDKEFYLHP